MEIRKKLFYRIGEACRITSVPAHVLRYWETEFSFLKPTKNTAGQRVYRYKDVLAILRIKQLLYEEGYTIAGAKKVMRRGSRGSQVEGEPDKPPAATVKKDTELAGIRRQLAEIQSILETWGI